MTSDKPNPPIDLSHAKEPPRSLNLDKAQDTIEAEADPKQNRVFDDLSHEQERAENVVARQVTIANIPGASVPSVERVD